MSKVLLDTEVLDIIADTIKNQKLPPKKYEQFLKSLGEAIADHFGGYVIGTSKPDGSGGPDDRYAVHVGADHRVSADGGPYARFDTDVTVADWMAESDCVVAGGHG